MKQLESHGQNARAKREEVQNIAEMRANRALKIYSLFPNQSELNEFDVAIPFNEEMTESIRRETAVAALDTLVRNNYVGRCWIVAN